MLSVFATAAVTSLKTNWPPSAEVEIPWPVDSERSPFSADLHFKPDNNRTRFFSQVTAGMFRKPYQPGDLVVYRKTKHSPHPGPRAEQIIPARSGDDYAYCVDKYWVVQECLPDNKLRVRTRRGKIHLIDSDDPNLRHANLWERWFLSGRFPRLESALPPESGTASEERAETPLSESPNEQTRDTLSPG